MDELVNKFWDALLAGDEEAANYYSQMIDQTIDYEWLVPPTEETEA